MTKLSGIWSIVPGELQGKARNEVNSLLDFESHTATEARLNAYQMQNIKEIQLREHTAKRKKVNFQDRRVECAYYCPHQLNA